MDYFGALATHFSGFGEFVLMDKLTHSIMITDHVISEGYSCFFYKNPSTQEPGTTFEPGDTVYVKIQPSIRLQYQYVRIPGPDVAPELVEEEVQ